LRLRIALASDYREIHFRSGAGYVVAANSLGARLSPKPQTNENAVFDRLTNLLNPYDGQAVNRARTERVMCYLAPPAVGGAARISFGAILLADHQLSLSPLLSRPVSRKNVVPKKN
jgi:hypothetical protein